MNPRNFSFLLFVFVVLNVSTQTLFTRKISTEDGLLSYDNYQSLVDKKGGVWIASESGIVKFSGNSYKHFTVKEGLITNDNWRLDLDSRNRIWLNNYNPGIQYIENNKVKTVEGSLKFAEIYFAGEHGDTVFFTVLEEGRVKRYFFADNHFGYYDAFKLNGFEIKADYRKFDFLLLQSDTSQFDFLFNISTKSIKKLPCNIVSLSSVNFRDNEIAVYTYNNSKHLVIPKRHSFETHKFDSIFGTKPFQRVKHAGNYVILKRESGFEIYNLKNSMKRDFEIEAIIIDNCPDPINLADISIDQQKNIWVQEERGEVYFIHNSARWAKQVHFSNYLDRNQALLDPLSVPNSNLVLFRNYRNEIYSIDKNTFKTKLVLSSIEMVQILLMGNRLFVLSPNILRSYKYDIRDGEFVMIRSSEKIIRLFKNSYSFCFLNSRSIILANGQKVRIKENDELVLDALWKINLPFRTINIAYKDSLLVYNSSAICGYYDFKLNKKGQFKIENPNSIYIDGNYILIGTRGRGIYLVNKKNYNRLVYNRFDYTISKIVSDKNGMYFCTNKGLFLAKIAENEKLIITKSYLTQKWFSLDISNAILGESMLLLTNRGIIELNDSQYDVYREHLSNYKVLLKSSGKLIESEAFILPYYTANLTFVLSKLSFFDISQTVFRYRLIGQNSNWVLGEKYTIDYSNLEPGTYIFEVETSDNIYGNFSNRRSVKLEIQQPFYFQWKYITLIVLLLILIVVLAFFVVNHFVLRRVKTKQKLKDLELKALRAQLNPHFVFNSLSGIQSALILKGQREANDYITAFATLIRKVLNNSRSEKISLANEIDFLKSYIDLENNRMMFPIDCSITNAPNIQADKIFIYAMVFQPIIENAILHAFNNKDTDKKVLINFELKKNILIVTISDNGMGMATSKKLTKEKIHESHASSILEEKSKLLNSLRKDELDITIDEMQPNEKGTRIIVKMRVEIKW